MTAEHILRRKGRDTIAIGPNETLKAAADSFTDHAIGALVVTNGKDELKGVISERDVVRAISTRGADALQATVGEVMSEEVLTCTPEESVKDLMERVTVRRVRHLPVVEDKRINGIISIGDLLKTRLEEMETEQQVLRDRLMGSGSNSSRMP